MHVCKSPRVWMCSCKKRSHVQIFMVRSRFLFSCFGHGSRKFGPCENFRLYGICIWCIYIARIIITAVDSHSFRWRCTTSVSPVSQTCWTCWSSTPPPQTYRYPLTWGRGQLPLVKNSRCWWERQQNGPIRLQRLLTHGENFIVGWRNFLRGCEVPRRNCLVCRLLRCF